MTSAPTRPSSDPYDDFVAKVAELRERTSVLEDEQMRMAFELKVRRAQTKFFPPFWLLIFEGWFLACLFPPPFFFFLPLVGPLSQEAHENIKAQSIAMNGLRHAALSFKEKATSASRSSRPVSPKAKRLRLPDPEAKTKQLANDEPPRPSRAPEP